MHSSRKLNPNALDTNSRTIHITPDQIMTAARKIQRSYQEANPNEELAETATEQDYIEATARWLETVLEDIMEEADWWSVEPGRHQHLGDFEDCLYRIMQNPFAFGEPKA